MLKQAIITEFQANRNFLLMWFAFNFLLAIAVGTVEQGVHIFMGISLLNFWIMLVVTASIAGHEKRNRLFAQLPVTPTQAFWAGWIFVLVWMTLQTLVWMTYGLVFTDTFTISQAGEIVTFALGALFFISVISIGLDLGAFRPFYLQWVYVFTMALLLALAIRSGISVGVLGNDEGIHFYPISLLNNEGLEILAGFALLAALLTSNFLVYRFSDNYLN